MKKLLCFSMLLLALTLMVGCGNDNEVTIEISPANSTVEVSIAGDPDAPANTPERTGVTRSVMLTVTAKHTEIALPESCASVKVGDPGSCKQVGRYSIEYFAPTSAGRQPFTITSLKDKGKTATAMINVIWAAPKWSITPTVGRIKTPRSQSDAGRIPACSEGEDCKKLKFEAKFKEGAGAPPLNRPIVYSITKSPTADIGTIDPASGVFTPNPNSVKGTATIAATTQYEMGSAVNDGIRDIVAYATVNVVEITGIKITSDPVLKSGTVSYNGEAPILTDLAVESEYNDGKTEKLAAGDYTTLPATVNITPANSAQVDATIQIRYQEGTTNAVTTPLTIKVMPARVSEITINNPKIDYLYSETFSTTGMTITGNYPPGTAGPAPITTGCTYQGISGSTTTTLTANTTAMTPSMTAVRVNCALGADAGNRTVTKDFPITVHKVTSLAVTGTQAEYEFRDELTAAKVGTVTATYDNGANKTLYSTANTGSTCATTPTGCYVAGYATTPAVGTKLTPEVTSITVNVTSDHGAPMPAARVIPIKVKALLVDLFEWVTPITGATNINISARPWIVSGNVAADFAITGTTGTSQVYLNKDTGAIVETKTGTDVVANPNALPPSASVPTLACSGGNGILRGAANNGTFTIGVIERSAGLGWPGTAIVCLVKWDSGGILAGPIEVGRYGYGGNGTSSSDYNQPDRHSAKVMLASDGTFILGHSLGGGAPIPGGSATVGNAKLAKMTVSTINPNDLTITAITNWKGTATHRFVDLFAGDDANNFVAIGSELEEFKGGNFDLTRPSAGMAIVMDKGTETQVELPTITKGDITITPYNIVYVLADGNKLIVAGTGTKDGATVGFVAKTKNKYFTEEKGCGYVDFTTDKPVEITKGSGLGTASTTGHWGSKTNTSGYYPSLNNIGIPDEAYVFGYYSGTEAVPSKDDLGIAGYKYVVPTGGGLAGLTYGEWTLLDSGFSSSFASYRYLIIVPAPLPCGPKIPPNGLEALDTWAVNKGIWYGYAEWAAANPNGATFYSGTFTGWNAGLTPLGEDVVILGYQNPTALDANVINGLLPEGFDPKVTSAAAMAAAPGSWGVVNNTARTIVLVILNTKKP